MQEWNRDEVGKGLFRSLEAARVEDYIKKPLGEIIAPLLTTEEVDRLPYGAILLLLLTYIDLLGYLHTGDPPPRNASRNAVNFIRKYLYNPY